MLGRLIYLVKFYGVGAINTIFGYVLFASLIYGGLSPFYSQTISIICGVTFNYFSYSKIIFKSGSDKLFKFMINYFVMYIYSIALLAALIKVTDPYTAGIIVLFVAAIVNYFTLTHLVFKRK
jgi:putative flippase GtrA